VVVGSKSVYICGLTRPQVRTLALLAEGLSNEEIGTRDGVRRNAAPDGKKTVVSDAVKAQLRAIHKIVFGVGEVNRVRLAFWYIDKVLPHDMLPNFAQPGDKLRAWKENARRAKELLERSGLLNDETTMLLELLADAQYAQKSNQGLADEMTRRLGMKIPLSNVKQRLTLMYRYAGVGSRVDLCVTLRLASLED
jgi:hypothetical protein